MHHGPSLLLLSSFCVQESRNIEEFGRNFAADPNVKIPWVRKDLCGSKVVVMEWIDGIRCTDVDGEHRTIQQGRGL